MNNKILGNKGEGLACDYLRKKGYRILERNFVSELGEVDVVAEKNGEVVFVEVKTKQTGMFFEPWVNVNRRKMLKVWETGQIFLKRNRLESSPVRIDVISVVMADEAGELRIEHFESVFEG